MFGQLRFAFNTSGFSGVGISDMFVYATNAVTMSGAGCSNVTYPRQMRVTRVEAEEVETTYLVKQIRGIECHKYVSPFRNMSHLYLSGLRGKSRYFALMINRYNILFLLVFIRKKHNGIFVYY